MCIYIGLRKSLKYIIDPLSRALWRLYKKFYITLKKRALTSGFFVVFFCLLTANWSSNSAFTTTTIEDTHLTLTVVLFKLEANNSLTILLLQTYEKKICRVFVPAKSVIPWLEIEYFYAWILYNIAALDALHNSGSGSNNTQWMP